MFMGPLFSLFHLKVLQPRCQITSLVQPGHYWQRIDVEANTCIFAAVDAVASRTGGPDCYNVLTAELGYNQHVGTLNHGRGRNTATHRQCAQRLELILIQAAAEFRNPLQRLCRLWQVQNTWPFTISKIIAPVGHCFVCRPCSDLFGTFVPRKIASERFTAIVVEQVLEQNSKRPPIHQNMMVR